MLINLSKLFLEQLRNKKTTKKTKIALLKKIIEFYQYDTKEIRFDEQTKDKILEKEAKTRDYFCNSQDLK